MSIAEESAFSEAAGAGIATRPNPQLASGIGRTASSTLIDAQTSEAPHHRRLLEPIGNVPPAELEMAYHRQNEESAIAA